jgi:hypothetical protein
MDESTPATLGTHGKARAASTRSKDAMNDFISKRNSRKGARLLLTERRKLEYRKRRALLFVLEERFAVMQTIYL